jgi:hypothetical protein
MVGCAVCRSARSAGEEAADIGEVFRTRSERKFGGELVADVKGAAVHALRRRVRANRSCQAYLG